MTCDAKRTCLKRPRAADATVSFLEEHLRRRVRRAEV